MRETFQGDYTDFVVYVDTWLIRNALTCAEVLPWLGKFVDSISHFVGFA